MKLIDWVILIAAAGLVALSVISLIRSHRNGSCSGCAGCPDRQSCSKKNKNDEHEA